MGIRLGVCGLGAFAPGFVPLFKAHPLVDEVVLADLLPDRVAKTAERFSIKRTCASLDELCESDVDAIAIMTQRHLHAPQALQALKAGKHVYCAVPIGHSVADIRNIIAQAGASRLVYMAGETSYYYPCTLYCRKRFSNGDFGAFVYGEAQYHHDMDHFYPSFQRSGGPDWKKVAGIPPMYYPTHSVSMILSVTGAHATHVSCVGFEDHHEDAIFRPGANLWNNTFSNETALMRTSDGGCMRICEFRRIGARGGISVLMSMYGTDGSYEQQANSAAWLTRDPNDMTELSDHLSCGQVPVVKPEQGIHETVLQEFHSSVSQVHPVEHLPRQFAGLPNGHSGSHQFLVDDFVKAVVSHTLPPNHAWAAARYCLPGLIAHESARRGGEMLAIPDLGDPPADWKMLDPYADIA